MCLTSRFSMHPCAPSCNYQHVLSSWPSSLLATASYVILRRTPCSASHVRACARDYDTGGCTELHEPAAARRVHEVSEVHTTLGICSASHGWQRLDCPVGCITCQQPRDSHDSPRAQQMVMTHAAALTRASRGSMVDMRAGAAVR